MRSLMSSINDRHCGVHLLLWFWHRRTHLWYLDGRKISWQAAGKLNWDWCNLQWHLWWLLIHDLHLRRLLNYDLRWWTRSDA